MSVGTTTQNSPYAYLNAVSGSSTGIVPGPYQKLLIN
jgi:hypothetical protein